MMKTYQVLHFATYDGLPLFDEKSGVTVVSTNHETIAEAAARREVSGDLVCDAEGNVVTDDQWLWDWEKNNVDSYAYRCVQLQKARSAGG